MKNNDFAKTLGTFLSDYLPKQRNVSANTISSYCDTFKLFLKFFCKQKGLSVDRITFKQLDRESVLLFLDNIEKERGCSVSTINQRLACIRSFFKYAQNERPDLLIECQKILNIPFRKHSVPPISYLSTDELRLILNQPNISNKSGRRDLTLLSLLYDTGARVQELADATVSSLRLEHPAQITLVGKGNKARSIPLLTSTVELLKGYLRENQLDLPQEVHRPLFFNQRKGKLSRAGICYVLKKYTDQARKTNPTLPENITPHIFRHSKAMHLLEAGVNIVYIRDILRHVDVSTTEIYAKANMQMKRTALEKVSHITVGNLPSWATDTDLLSWLVEFGKVKK